MASLSVTSVFAATPARLETAHQKQVDEALQSDWKADTIHLQTEKLQNILIPKLAESWLKDNPNSTDRVKVENDLHKANVLMLQVETSLSKHTGFNANGIVTDSFAANQTLLQLSTDLHELHTVLIHNLDSLLQ